MSDLIQKFRETCDSHDVTDWEKYYNGEDKIKEATEKNWKYIQDIKKNLDKLTKEDVYNWTHDLIINKTHSGLQIQLDVLKLSCNGKPYRLSNTAEEAKGIDGFIDNEPVSIKPDTYKKTIEYGKEKIPYRIIFYTKGKQGIKIK